MTQVSDLYISHLIFNSWLSKGRMSINTLNVYAVQNVIFLILTAIRLLVLAALTGFARVKTKQFHAPEDNRNGGEATSFGGAEGSGGMTLPDRVMRAHYNA